MNTPLPVTTILKIRYREGCRDACLEWMQETALMAGAFPGFMEKDILYSATTEKELINIFTFSHKKYLDNWEHSSFLADQSKKAAAFVEAIQSKSQMTSLEFMFNVPHAPKRWKMVIVTIAVIFILLNSMVPVLQQFFTTIHLPLLIKSILGVAIMVILMTYIIIPFLSRILVRWLSA